MTNRKAKKTNRDATRKANERNELSQEDADDRIDVLLGESRKFCKAMGLHEDLILQIAKSDTDWAFILKIDALLETASKEIIRHGLRLEIFDKVIRNGILGEFVDSLPMGGRISLLKLLEAAGCPPEEHGFIEATRQVRNAYAHNIRLLEVSLIELIKSRPDKVRLIKYLSAIEHYDEASLIASYEKDGSFLRFAIVDSTMRFLRYAYHIAVKQAEPAAQ